MPRNSPAPCGTYAAYTRHIRNGEPADAACREACAEYARKRLGCSKRVAAVMINLTCGFCGETFRGKAERRFCSRTCSSRWAGHARTIRSADDRRLARSHRECAAPGLSYSRRRQLVTRWIKQGRTCTYCDRPATTIDHVLPLVRGGTNYEGNLAPACKSCNSSKSGWTVIEWRTGRRLAPMRRPVTHTAPKRRCEGCGEEYQPKSSSHRYCAKRCRPKKPPAPPARCQVCAADCHAPRRVVCSDECERIRCNEYMRNRYRESVGIPVSAPLYTRAA